MSNNQAQFENYKKIKMLGEGSFGKAFLVQAESSKEMMVIKQMDLSKMSEDERRDTLVEAKILERLQHPNIIRFNEVYKTKKGKLCIVMEYADGGDLAQKVAAMRGRDYFKENYILDTFVQICLGVKHIHDRKVLHRDLKSQNVFLTKSNMVKLGDFGIAKMLTSTNQMVKTMVGTPYQLSPEIVEGKKQNFKSDIWSLGVLLQEMCTLKPPFDANSLQQLARKIAKGTYAPIPTHYSKDIKTLLNSLLSTDQRKRPRIHEILAMPIIKGRIREFLTTTIANLEFNHTVIHKKDLYQIANEEKENRPSRPTTQGSNQDREADMKKQEEEKAKIEKEKQQREEALKRQRQMQEEKEKERLKREREKEERLRKEKERARIREVSRLQEIRDQRSSRQSKRADESQNSSRSGTPSQRDKEFKNRVPSRQRLESPRLESPSPKLPNIHKRPLSSRNNHEVKGFNIHGNPQQINARRESQGERKDVYQIPPSNGSNQSKSRMQEVDAKLEQLKREREQRLIELEQKKKIVQDKNQKKLKLKSKHTSSNSSLASESRKSKGNIHSIPYKSNRSSESSAYQTRQNTEQSQSKSEIQDSVISYDKASEKSLMSIDDKNASAADLPMGINENLVDPNNLDQLGQEMLDAFLEDAPNSSPSEDEDEPQEDKLSSKPSEVLTNNDRDEFDTQLNTEESEDNPKKVDHGSSFSGDMKQFHEYLQDRLGNHKLNLVRKLINEFNMSDGNDEQEKDYKNKLEKILSDKERATQLPMIHALINMEDFIKNKNKQLSNKN